MFVRVKKHCTMVVKYSAGTCILYQKLCPVVRKMSVRRRIFLYGYEYEESFLPVLIGVFRSSQHIITGMMSQLLARQLHADERTDNMQVPVSVGVCSIVDPTWLAKRNQSRSGQASLQLRRCRRAGSESSEE